MLTIWKDRRLPWYAVAQRLRQAGQSVGLRYDSCRVPGQWGAYNMRFEFGRYRMVLMFWPTKIALPLGLSIGAIAYPGKRYVQFAFLCIHISFEWKERDAPD